MPETTVRSVKVLIVDDSSIIRERLTEQLLRIQNVEIVGQLENAKDALDAFRLHDPDVVILDIQLQDGDGFGLLDTIKALHPQKTVIVFTNYATAQHRKRSKASGADFFLDKSNGFNSVYDLVHWMAQDTGRLHQSS